MYGWRGRIGVIVPCPNVVIEPEFNTLAREIPGISVHSVRMHLEVSEDKGLSKQALLDMELQAVESVVSELAHAKVDVIVYGCTSGSFVGGPGRDQELTELIVQKTNVPTTTTSTAIVAALEALGVQKIAMGTPYNDEISMLGKAFFEGAGFQVLNAINLDNVLDIHSAPPGQAYNLARSVDVPTAECVFISCTQFPAIQEIEMIERDLGKPVFSSNSASFWHALQFLRVDADLSQYGVLFSKRSNRVIEKSL